MVPLAAQHQPPGLIASPSPGTRLEGSSAVPNDMDGTGPCQPRHVINVRFGERPPTKPTAASCPLRGPIRYTDTDKEIKTEGQEIVSIGGPSRSSSGSHVRNYLRLSLIPRTPPNMARSHSEAIECYVKTSRKRLKKIHLTSMSDRSVFQILNLER